MSWIEQIVKQHVPQEGAASVYGIVLFTDSHPNIKKIVYDDDYWRALDEISGGKWVIFCTRARQGKIGFSPPPPGVYAEMAPIWKEPKENKDLIDIFDLKSTQRFPLLLVFAFGQDGELLKNNLSLSDASVNEAYNSIKTAVKTVTDALEAVHEKNLKNALGVHSAVSLAVQNAKDWAKVKKGVRFWQWLKSIT